MMSSSAKPCMEEQLSLYRARKKREEENKVKRQRIWELVTWIMSFGSSPSSSSDDPKDASDSAESHSDVLNRDEQEYGLMEKEQRKRTVSTKDSSSGGSSDHFDPQSLSEPSFIESYSTLDWIALGLKCLMWMLLWKVFILLEFGAVFFIFSAFVFIWYNMRSGPKKRGEISAYSVFNPNCEGIEGTFTAEQFERELLHKMY